MPEPILVTGGAGYIGSHVCKTLAKAGFFPIAYDNLSVGHAYAVKWGPLVQADLCDQEKLHAAFKKFRPKAVLHFASFALVVESMQDPGKYYRNNLVSSLALLEAMREAEVPYIVFSSTCATYGQPQSISINEEHPQIPVNPYGKSKLMIEQILADFETSHGIKSAILRYFNVGGADLETEIGENHTPETHLIPSVIQVGLGLKKELVVYGADFPSLDGSAIRDYVHVQDLADAHVAALQKLLARKNSFQINLGSGKGCSVLEIIRAVEQFTGKHIPVRLEGRRPGEPAHLTADITKALEFLGWSPRLSQLPILIESAWKWHQFLAENAPQIKKFASC
ncbi:MAG: UDP-glucose 4-epimerase GalE [Chlamydiia bacterium]|nr:UDP-glucose 4-epimerase GalE [Chlamydiia bacterium]